MKFHQCMKFLFSLFSWQYLVLSNFAFFLVVEMIPYCFNLYYLDNYWGWTYFRMCIGHLNSLFWKMPVQVFCSFSYCVVFLTDFQNSLYLLDLYLLPVICFVNPVCGLFFFLMCLWCILYIEVLHFHVVKAIHLLFIACMFELCLKKPEHTEYLREQRARRADDRGWKQISPSFLFFSSFFFYYFSIFPYPEIDAFNKQVRQLFCFDLFIFVSRYLWLFFAGLLSSNFSIYLVPPVNASGEDCFVPSRIKNE